MHRAIGSAGWSKFSWWAGLTGCVGNCGSQTRIGCYPIPSFLLLRAARHLPLCICLQHHTPQQSSLGPAQALFLLPPSAPQSRPTATQKPPSHPGLPHSPPPTPTPLLCWRSQDPHRCPESMHFPSTTTTCWSSQGFTFSNNNVLGGLSEFTVAAAKEPLGPHPCRGSILPDP